MQQRLNTLFPDDYPEMPEGGAIGAFGLP